MAPHVIEIAIEPKTNADHEKMAIALTRLAAEDPNFSITTDHESGQTIIAGVTDLQLEDLVDRLTREFKVEVYVGAPQVAYRETLATAVEVDFTHKKHTGISPQFGRVKVRVVPRERGSGVQFFNEIKGSNIPREYIPAIEKGMRETAQIGALIGFPIIDFEIHLIDGAYHDIDSSKLAFEIAGRGAMHEAAKKAGIEILEPIMKVEVVAPDAYVGDVIGALNNRRGWIQGTDSLGDALVIVATAPLAQLFGLHKELESLSGGGAALKVDFDRYDVVESTGTDPDDTFPVAAALRA